MENRFFPIPLCLSSLQYQIVKRHLESIYVANAVILVFAPFWKHPLFFSKLAGMFDFFYFPMFFCQNGCKILSIRGMNGKSGILDPMKFWQVPQVSEMIVPESSHDRCCSEKSSCKAPSSILISESAFGPKAVFFRVLRNVFCFSDKWYNWMQKVARRFIPCVVSTFAVC